MNLGETIFRLRSERNLSQGDLADALDVSRQSISKWENNGAVPELDKLVKLSDLFGVTLDVLVRDEEPAPPPEVAAVQQSGFPSRKIAGTILLCMGALIIIMMTLMGSLLTGLVFSSPFLCCGLICFVAQRHPGLWCAWSVYLLVDLYLRYATGINWRLTLYTTRFTPEMNYVRLAIGWGQLLGMLLLVAITVFRFRKTTVRLVGRKRILVIAGWIVFLLLHVPALFWGERRWFALVMVVFDWARLGLLTALLIPTLCALRERKGKQDMTER